MSIKPEATNQIEKVLKKCFKTLSKREQFIVEGVEGLLANIPKRTLADIGRELNISRERTRQLYNRAIAKFAKTASSVPVQRKILSILSSIEMVEHGCNLADFFKQIRESFPNKNYEAVTGISLLYRYVDGELITSNNQVPFRSFFSVKEQTLADSNSFPLINWFRGLRKSELTYLKDRFNLFTSETALQTHSLPQNLWHTLGYRGLHSYLEASDKYPLIEDALNRVLNKIEQKQGSVSSGVIEEFVKEEFNIKGVNIHALCSFLSDFSKKFKYDPKHFLWILKGYSWQSNKRYSHDRSEILMATGKEMSHTNIAHKILLEENKAMPVKKIAQNAIERGLMKTTSSNPGGGLKTLIYLEIQRDRKLFRESRFKILPDWSIELTGKGREFATGDGRLSRQSSKQTIADCAYLTLLASKKAMHFADIYTAIRNHPQMRMRDDSSEQSIKRVMSAEKNKTISRFKKLENGYWTLSENHKAFDKI